MARERRRHPTIPIASDSPPRSTSSCCCRRTRRRDARSGPSAAAGRPPWLVRRSVSAIGLRPTPDTRAPSRKRRQIAARTAGRAFPRRARGACRRSGAREQWAWRSARSQRRLDAATVAQPLRGERGTLQCLDARGTGGLGWASMHPNVPRGAREIGSTSPPHLVRYQRLVRLCGSQLRALARIRSSPRCRDDLGLHLPRFRSAPRLAAPPESDREAALRLGQSSATATLSSREQPAMKRSISAPLPVS